MKIKENQRVKRIEKHAIDETRLYLAFLVPFYQLFPLKSTFNIEINRIIERHVASI